VVYDDGDSPEGDIVGTFNIFKNLVGNSATTINRVNVSMHGRGLQVGTKYWIILKKQGDASNHFLWHHDNGTSAVEAERATTTWTVDATGRALTHRVYCSRRVLTEASDQASIDRYGVVETVVDAPWIIEGRMMDAYLTAILQYSARQKRAFDIRQIYAPTTVLTAGKLVRLVDTLSGVDADAELLSVRYKFDQSNSLGTRYCEIAPVAFMP
jgi:hypothetical protein